MENRTHGTGEAKTPVLQQKAALGGRNLIGVILGHSQHLAEAHKATTVHQLIRIVYEIKFDELPDALHTTFGQSPPNVENDRML